jgi:hypothetical protein
MPRLQTSDLEPHSFHVHLAVALKSAEMRRACLAVERIVSCIDLLDQLSPAALEEVRDYCTDYNKGRKGKFSEFKRAFIAMVVDHLHDVRLQERRLFYGITGKELLDDRLVEQERDEAEKDA